MTVVRSDNCVLVSEGNGMTVVQHDSRFSFLGCCTLWGAHTYGISSGRCHPQSAIPEGCSVHPRCHDAAPYPY